jgi:hypothetical protein
VPIRSGSKSTYVVRPCRTPHADCFCDVGSALIHQDFRTTPCFLLIVSPRQLSTMISLPFLCLDPFQFIRVLF